MDSKRCRCDGPIKDEDIFFDIRNELYFARQNYNTHPSLEHSLCVLQEELDELKKEIYLKPSKRNEKRIYEEAIQVAAMAIRLVSDMEQI